MTTTTDVINTLADIASDSPLAALRAQRPEALAYTQGSDAALLHPADPAGVSLIERQLIGLRVAKLTNAPDVAARHRAELTALGANPADIGAAEIGDAKSTPRLAALFRFAETLTHEPREATPELIAALHDAGLSARDVVTVAQLISYLNFQVRLLAGLRALGETTGGTK